MKSEAKLAHSWHFEAIGTQWEIASAAPISVETKRVVQGAIEAFDAAYSRFRADSLVQKLAQSGGSVVFPESAEEIFSFYETLFALTEGKVTPLIGDTLVSAGYDATYSLKPAEVIAPTLDYLTVVKREHSTLTLSQPALLDIGAAGKGYLVDEVVRILSEAGHEVILVDASGDLRVVGEHTEMVGLENPLRSDEVIGAVEITNASLCASAVNRRAWGDWHHVIDPSTAKPTRDVIATWVKADSTMIADGLATALFFTRPEVLATKYTYEYIRMYGDGSIECSDYFEKGVYA